MVKYSNNGGNVRSNSTVVCLCPLEGVIDIISKKWALLIINEIGNHRRIRYTDLKKELQSISPKTLADTLKELKNSNLVKRESFNEIPPRVDYTLTQDGEKLREAIVPILRWAISTGTNIADQIIFDAYPVGNKGDSRILPISIGPGLVQFSIDTHKTDQGYGDLVVKCSVESLTAFFDGTQSDE